MDLYYDSAGPTLDVGVRARLRRLDPDLAVTFCRYAIDTATSRPVEIGEDYDPAFEPLIDRRAGSRYLVSPQFHLWVRQASGRWFLIKSYPAAQGFGHREVLSLERDAARFMRPEDITRRAREIAEARAEKRRAAQLQLRKDVAEANMGRIRRMVDSGDRGYRQGRVTSFGGQTSRATPGTVRKDDREDGWELPSRGDY